MCTVPVLNRLCRECYSDPLEVYHTLKRRGMHLVTVTDHDSIDAAESLRRYPDFFLSEEVRCRASSGTHLHIGVYGIDDRDHIQLQRRREDLPSLLVFRRPLRRRIPRRTETRRGHGVRRIRRLWETYPLGCGNRGFHVMREHPWALLLSPLLAVVPLVTAGNLRREIYFAHAWGRRLDRGAAFTQEAFLRCGSSSASS